MGRRPAARLKHTHIDDDHDYDPEEWELWYRTARNGRENRVIFWCRACGYREKPQPWPVQSAQAHRSICPQCREHGIRFVAYQEGAEDALAEAVIKGELPMDRSN